VQLLNEQSAPCQFWWQEHFSLAPQMPLPLQELGQMAAPLAMREIKKAVLIVCGFGIC
jgi:hypothetical protein